MGLICVLDALKIVKSVFLNNFVYSIFNNTDILVSTCNVTHCFDFLLFYDRYGILKKSNYPFTEINDFLKHSIS